jgi:hypothetical protein
MSRTHRKPLSVAEQRKLKARVTTMDRSREALALQIQVEANRAHGYLIAAGVVNTRGEAEAITPTNALDFLRKQRAERDALKRDLEGATCEHRHHLESLERALDSCAANDSAMMSAPGNAEPEPESLGVIAASLVMRARMLAGEAAHLRAELERERLIVDALVRKAAKS